jgi:tetraacyldisaccharide 4'-kinase
VVRSSDPLPSTEFIGGDFPHGRAQRPAFLTIPASWLYGFGATLYHASFRTSKIYRPPVPVISVGNLSVGGTGKTPLVIALARLLREEFPALCAANRIAVLSRGYGRTAKAMTVVEETDHYERAGDEPLLIKRAIPELAVVVHARRDWCARYACERLGSRLLLLDDGFQHRRIARDLDLVVMDGEAPLGNGYCLPAGPLRERPQALRRATAFVAVGGERKAAEDLGRRFGKPVVGAERRMVLPMELSTKLSTPLYVLTSIGRPKRFLKGLRDMGLLIAGGQAFGDHHRFTSQELFTVAQFAAKSGAKAVVCTAKDRIRIAEWPGTLPLWTVDLETGFSDVAVMRQLISALEITVDNF